MMNYKMVFLFFLFLSGCQQSIQKEPNQIGLANPASVYCAILHGKSIPIDTPQGQYANCALPSGEIIEEWSLYRRDHHGIDE